MFTFVVPTAEEAGTTPELNASNAHIPLQWAALATREAGIGASLSRVNRPIIDGAVNHAYSPEGEVLRAMANARLATLEVDVHAAPEYRVDLTHTDAATAQAFIDLVNTAAAANTPAKGDSPGVQRGKALRMAALKKVTEVVTK